MLDVESNFGVAGGRGLRSTAFSKTKGVDELFEGLQRENGCANRDELLTRCGERLYYAVYRRRARGSASFGVEVVFLRNRRWASTGRLGPNRKLSFCVLVLPDYTDVVMKAEVD